MLCFIPGVEKFAVQMSSFKGGVVISQGTKRTHLLTIFDLIGARGAYVVLVPKDRQVGDNK